MKAIRIHRYGGPEVLVYEEAPRPEPAAGEVLLEVHAAGVNPVDWKIREGQRRERWPHRLPLVPGWDVSGVIAAVGPGVTRWKGGEAVYSRPDILRDGAYADYLVVRETEVAYKPRILDHVHAAAIPLAGLTAWQALFDVGQVTSGQRVLIHAAAGGVGGYAVQLAKGRGAHVIGTASARNRAYVRGLGADEVIDYQATRFEQAVREVDVVFDTIGGDVQARSWSVLKPGGMLVSIVQPPPEPPPRRDVRSGFLVVQPNAGQLEQLAQLVEAGRLAVTVECVLPLEQARRAQELSQTGHVRGKIVLQVRPG